MMFIRSDANAKRRSACENKRNESAGSCLSERDILTREYTFNGAMVNSSVASEIYVVKYV